MSSISWDAPGPASAPRTCSNYGCLWTSMLPGISVAVSPRLSKLSDSKHKSLTTDFCQACSSESSCRSLVVNFRALPALFYLSSTISWCKQSDQGKDLILKVRDFAHSLLLTKYCRCREGVVEAKIRSCASISFSLTCCFSLYTYRYLCDRI